MEKVGLRERMRKSEWKVMEGARSKGEVNGLARRGKREVSNTERRRRKRDR